MKTDLLKQLRFENWRRYEVRKSDAVNAGDKPWRIYTGPKTSLAYCEYATREAAVEEVKKMWHEVAAKYLWEHRLERKRNKYPY